MPIESDAEVSQIKGVEDSDGQIQPPATGAFDHAGGAGADPSSTVEETMSVPDRAETVTLLASGADNSFSVELIWNNTSISYSGDSTTDVDVERSVVGDSLTVKITGSATNIDYDIYVR